MLGLTGFRCSTRPRSCQPTYICCRGPISLWGPAGTPTVGRRVSPILGALHIEHRKHVLPVSMMLGTLMRVPILGLAVSGWFLHGQILLVTAMILLFLLGVFSGPQGVAFQFLLAKMIPISRRGRLQGWRNMTGGLIAAALSYLAGKYLVGHNAFGNGFGTTFLAAFVLTSLGLTAFGLLVREPELPTMRPKVRIAERLRDFPMLLKGDPNFLYFMIARTFAIANRVAAPFYIVYASQTSRSPAAPSAYFPLPILIADTAANLIWDTCRTFRFPIDFRGPRSSCGSPRHCC